MIQGDQEYRRLLHKLHALESVGVPTLAQEVEIAHINTRLTTVVCPECMGYGYIDGQRVCPLCLGEKVMEK